MGEMVRFKESSPVPPLYWVLFSAFASALMIFLFPLYLENYNLPVVKNKIFLSSIVSFPISIFFIKIADFLRRWGIPTHYYTKGLVDSIQKKFFWLYGPQFVGLITAQILVFSLFSHVDNNSLSFFDKYVLKKQPQLSEKKTNSNPELNKNEQFISNNKQSGVYPSRVKVNSANDEKNFDNNNKSESSDITEFVSSNETPPAEFLQYNLRVVYHGIAEGGTQSANIAVEDFVDLGLKNRGNWEKLANNDWIYRVKETDKVTGDESNIAFVFSRIEQDKLSEFFKNDVLLTRINNNGNELSSREIWMLAGPISNKVYSQSTKRKVSNTFEKENNIKNINKNNMDLNQSNSEKSNTIANIIKFNQDNNLVNSIMQESSLKFSGEVIQVSPIEGSGGFWSVLLKIDKSKELEIQCSSQSELYIRDGEQDLEKNAGYELLKNLPKEIDVFFPRENENKINECLSDNSCTVFDCPKVIVIKQKSKLKNNDNISNNGSLKDQKYSIESNHQRNSENTFKVSQTTILKNNRSKIYNDVRSNPTESLPKTKTQTSKFLNKSLKRPEVVMLFNHNGKYFNEPCKWPLEKIADQILNYNRIEGDPIFAEVIYSNKKIKFAEITKERAREFLEMTEK